MKTINGYKSYIIAAGSAVFGIVGYLMGNLDSTAATGFIFSAGGLAALRHGFSTESITIIEKVVLAILQNMQPPKSDEKIQKVLEETKTDAKVQDILDKKT